MLAIVDLHSKLFQSKDMFRFLSYLNGKNHGDYCIHRNDIVFVSWLEVVYDGVVSLLEHLDMLALLPCV